MQNRAFSRIIIACAEKPTLYFLIVIINFERIIMPSDRYNEGLSEDVELLHHDIFLDDFLDDDDIFDNNGNLIDFSKQKDTDSFEYEDINFSDDYSAHHSNKNRKHHGKKKKSPQTMSEFVISEIISYIKIIFFAVLFAIIIVKFIIINATVPTGSMRTTICQNDKLIGSRITYKFSKPKQGDIVVFKFPDDESEIFIKRLIGLPGDVIEIKEGHVYVNNVMLNEDYINEPMIDDGLVHTYTVPEDCYFMLGDNRNNSKDSRYWVNTYVKKDQIIAKAVFKYYDGEKRQFKFSTF